MGGPLAVRAVSADGARRICPVLASADDEQVEAVLERLRALAQHLCATLERKPSGDSESAYQAEVEALVEQAGFSPEVAARAVSKYYGT